MKPGKKQPTGKQTRQNTPQKTKSVTVSLSPAAINFADFCIHTVNRNRSNVIASGLDMAISEICMSEEFNAALNTPEVKKILPHYAEGIKYAGRLSNMRHLKKALKQVMAQKSPPKHIKP